MEIIYVGGYGRSGSSVLDREIARRSSALSAGELCNLFSWAVHNRKCTCGAPLSECRFWAPVLVGVESRTGLTYGEMAEVTAGAELRGSGDSDRDARWSVVWGSLLLELESKGVTRLVDSSKSAGLRRRLVLLSRLDVVDGLHFVHLVRGLGAVIESSKKGSNTELEKAASTGFRVAGIPAPRTALAWTQANIFAALTGVMYGDSYERIRYENLGRDRISQLASAYPTAEVGQQLSEELLDHQVAGNRALRSGEREFVPRTPSYGRGEAAFFSVLSFPSSLGMSVVTVGARLLRHVMALRNA